MSALEHPALLYESIDEFLSYLVPFVAQGIRRGEPVFVAVGPRELAALRHEIGEHLGAVQWADTRHWHPNSSTRLRASHELLVEWLEGGAERVRLVGEPVWPDEPELVGEWQRYESVLNEVLAPFPVTLVCTYDASRLDRSIIEAARHTHPELAGDEPASSDEFEDPAEFLSRVNSAVAAAPPSATRLSEPNDLFAARRLVAEQAILAGMRMSQVTDLQLAATEILSNAIRHGGGATALWVWSDDGRFLCQVEDRGPGIEDPLAGYLPPGIAAEDGRGLWITRQLVDLLQIGRTLPGTRVRFHMTRASGGAGASHRPLPRWSPVREGERP